MKIFEKTSKIKIPNFVKSYSPVIGLGGVGAGTGAAIGAREDSSFSPLKGAAGGALLGAAYGGVVKKGISDLKKASKEWDDVFGGFKGDYGDFSGGFKGDFRGSGGSSAFARRTVDLGADLKNLHLNKAKIKTKKEVKKQYRNMARRYHPDVNPKGEEKFKRIAGSWENIQGTSWYEKLAKLKKENYKMKYFEKNAAFDPKRLIGPAVGAAALGTLGYATADKEDKISAGISTGVLGGIVGLAFKGKGGLLPKGSKGPKRKSFFEDMAEKMNPLDETEKVLEKSREEMKKVDSMRSAIKTHTTTKGDFKYKDALKMTKEKKAAFLAEMTKLAVFFEKTEKDLTNKELQKELRRGYFSGGLDQTAFGGMAGAYTQSFLGKVGKRPWKGLAVGAAAGLALTPVSNVLDKKDILKEVDRRKKNPGYK